MRYEKSDVARFNGLNSRLAGRSWLLKGRNAARSTMTFKRVEQWAGMAELADAADSK